MSSGIPRIFIRESMKCAKKFGVGMLFTMTSKLVMIHSSSSTTINLHTRTDIISGILSIYLVIVNNNISTLQMQTGLPFNTVTLCEMAYY